MKGNVSLVDIACLLSTGNPFSTLQPYGHQMSTVSLLPSGPEPISVVKGLCSLRNDNNPAIDLTGQGFAVGITGIQQIADAALGLRPPRFGDFG